MEKAIQKVMTLTPTKVSQKQYRIMVETTFTTEFIVKADSTQKAEEKLNAMYEDGSAYAVEMDQCNTNTIYKSITQL